MVSFLDRKRREVTILDELILVGEVNHDEPRQYNGKILFLVYPEPASTLYLTRKSGVSLPRVASSYASDW